MTCCSRNILSRWNGNCTTEALSPEESKGDFCSCGSGSVSTDSLGSCVPIHALTAMFASAGSIACLALLFLLRKARKHRLSLKSVRVVRRRMLLGHQLIRISSVYSGSASIIFYLAAPRVIKASVMLQLLYTMSFPMIIYAAAIIMAIWVDTIPKQLLRAGVRSVQRSVEKRKAFERVGLLGMAVCGSLGAMTFFVLDPIKVVTATNLMTAFTAIVAIICFLSVAILLTRIIDDAKRKAHGSNSAVYFYNQALKILWAEVLALSLTAAVWAASALALELSEIGRATPEIPIALMATDASVGFSLAVQFSRMRPTVSSVSSPRSSKLKPVRSKKKTTQKSTAEEKPQADAETGMEGGDALGVGGGSLFLESGDSDHDNRKVRSMSFAIAEALRQQMLIPRRAAAMASVEKGRDKEGIVSGRGMEPSVEETGDPREGSQSPLSGSMCHGMALPPEGLPTPTWSSKTAFDPSKRSSFYERFMRPIVGRHRVLPALAYQERTPASPGVQLGRGSGDARSSTGSRDQRCPPPSPVGDGST